jgi:hypothetical protein
LALAAAKHELEEGSIRFECSRMLEMTATMRRALL